MSQDFEKAKAFLKKSNSDGNTLYDHITKVLLKISKDKPEDPLASFEKTSKAVKSANLNPTVLNEIPTEPIPDTDKENLVAACNATLALFDAPYVSTEDKATAIAAHDKINIKNEDEEEDEDAPKVTLNDLLPASLKSGAVPNIVANGELLASAGFGLTEEETYRVSLGVKRLARKAPVESVRFFGKIMGTEKDYYICEGKLLEVEKEPVDFVTKKEVAGKGANEFVYYATNSPEGEWKLLPDVLPEQIITARIMRRYFTGNLQAPVKGLVRFPWPEASYLRAQIARISAASTVSPKGFYTVEEGDEEEGIPDKMLEDPEFEPLGAEELKEAENWCHHRAHLLKQGRAAKWEEPEGEDDEEEEAGEDEEEEEEEEPIPLLNGLDADEGKGMPLWRFSNTPGQHGVSMAISLAWPGAVSVASKKKMANIYVGWGQKQLKELYTPPPPAPVQSEYVSNFNAEEAEEDETDPTLEQLDPQPPQQGGDGDEGDEGDED